MVAHLPCSASLLYLGNTTRSSRYGALLLGLLLSIAAWGQTTITAERSWISYLGGEGDDQVLCVALDAFGHVYVVGRTAGGLLLGNDTTGQSGLTHQAVFAGGGSDAFLAKFAPQGSVLWMTYFGGEGDDEAVAVVVTEMDGVYLVGNTTSATGIATDTLAYQTVPGGGTDLFIARFTEYGLLLGATYFGGADEDLASGSALDVNGRLLVCGSSTGGSGLSGNVLPLQPYTAGTDGLLLLYAGTDSLMLGTYVGGEGDDVLVQVVPGDSSGVVLLGNTTSSTGIATSDGLTTELQGDQDAFLLKADTNLVTLRGTYFGGAAFDRATGMARQGDRIAICGISHSDTLYTDSTSYRPTNSGGGDGFLALLDTALTLSRCTFVGDTAYDALMAVSFDAMGMCFVAGITASDSSVATATQSGFMLNGPTDGLLMRFEEDLALTWARYLGALGEEEAHALAVAGHTALFVGGRTGSSELFSYAGHQMDYGGGVSDGFTARLDQVTSTICEGICVGGMFGGGGGYGVNGVSPPLLQYDVCLGDTVTFIVYGGALGYQAEWMWYADDCGNPQRFITMGDTISFVATESFNLSVRAESMHHVTGCRYLPIVVHTYPQPVVSATDTLCAGSPIVLQGSYAETFHWTLGDTTVTGAQAELPAPLTPGPVMVQVSAVNGPACAVQLELPVFVRPLPETHWMVNDVSCADGTDGAIALDSTLAATVDISWSQAGLQGAVLSGLGAGTYIATVTDLGGCITIDTLVVHMPPALLDSVSTVDALCGEAVGSAQVHGPGNTAGLLFDWGNGADTLFAVQGLPPGLYTVVVTDSAGCMEQRSFSIEAIGTISVVIAGDTVVAEDGTVQLQCYTLPPDSLASYLWTPATGLDDPLIPSPTCTVDDTTTYVVHVLSALGCTASDTVVVVPLFTIPPTLPEPCGEAFLPELFSPNNDGLNDELCVLGGCFTSLLLNIYDRWGQLVFVGNTADECWDGSHGGTTLPPGAYAFTLSATRSTGEAVERTGVITLKR
jgi:gliding motility-associated-like protein